MFSFANGNLEFIQTITFDEDGHEASHRGKANYFALLLRYTPMSAVCCEMVANYFELPALFSWTPSDGLFLAEKRLIDLPFFYQASRKRSASVKIFNVKNSLSKAVGRCFWCFDLGTSLFECHAHFTPPLNTSPGQIFCCPRHAYLLEWK